ncbi:MAG: PP2C family protein-serine/threonine phosphatase [Wenzhouxiangella sp.]
MTDVGLVRASNQDAILTDDALGLWLVADGMGGHAGGAHASQLAARIIRERVHAGAALSDAILAAHQAIQADQRAHPEMATMGTTVVAVHETAGEWQLCWTGDSRAYRMRHSARAPALQRLTRDHNVAGMLLAAGALKPEEAERHPQKHVLTDCLGIPGEKPPRIECQSLDLAPGDWLLLCSDGLSGELDDQRLEKLLAQKPRDLSQSARRLLEAALDAGAHDNVSVVLVASTGAAASTPPPKPEGWRRLFRRG